MLDSLALAPRWLSLALAASTIAMATSGWAQGPLPSTAAPTPTAIGVPGGLTSEVVAERAAATSFDVRARRSDLLRAAAGVDRALAAFIPKTTVSARYTRLSSIDQGSAGSLVVAPGAGPGPLPPGAPLANAPLTFPQILDQYALQASLTVPASDYFLRMPQTLAAARKSALSATHLGEAARRRAATDGRLAYYGWVQARLETEIAEQSWAQANAHLVDVLAAEQVGSATPADVLAVKARVASSEVLVERARSLARVTEERLRTLMHGGAPRTFEIGEDIRQDPAALPPGASAEGYYRQAIQTRPEVKALTAQAESLRKRAQVERAGTLPRLDAFANAQYSNPNARVFPQEDELRGSWDVGAVLTWTISDVPGASAAARGAEAELARTLADKGALEDSLRIEVTEAFEAAREADASIGPVAERLLAAAEAHRVRRELFKAGRGTSVELTDAEAELTRARIDELYARVSQRVARARLAHAAGGKPGT